VSRARNLILLTLVLACAASIWYARRQPTLKPVPGPTLSQESQAAPAQLDAVHLSVLNGSGVSGLARRIGRLLPALGCVVVKVGNAPHENFSSSLLINRRLPAHRAEILQRQLGGLPMIVEWDPRCREDAVLILGHDYDDLEDVLKAKSS